VDKSIQWEKIIPNVPKVASSRYNGRMLTRQRRAVRLSPDLLGNEGVFFDGAGADGNQLGPDQRSPMPVAV